MKIKKILSNGITLAAEIAALIAGTLWLINSNEIWEPLILLIISGASFITTWILRSGDTDIDIPLNQTNNYEYHAQLPWWERLAHDIGIIDLIERIKNSAKNPQTDLSTHDLPRFEYHPPEPLPDLKEHLLSHIDIHHDFPDDIHDHTDQNDPNDHHGDNGDWLDHIVS